MSARLRWPATIRLRLTLWYGGLFLLAGFLLLSINFALFRENFPSDQSSFRAAIAERFGVPVEELRGDRLIDFGPVRPGHGTRPRGP